MAYKDPVINAYIELVKDKTSVFKSFHYGDPIRLAASDLPALIIAKNDTSVDKHTNAEDQHEIGMLLTVVTDMRDTANGDIELAEGTSQLYDILEGRDESFRLKEDSILSILRKNLNISDNLVTDLSSATEVDYVLTVDKRQQGHWATEAQVQFRANLHQLR